jgi:Flp pilus assembly protein TadG
MSVIAPRPLSWRRAAALLVRDRSGSAAVEYALVLPAFLIMMLGALDAGRVIWLHTTLQQAVDAAARCAAINTTRCGTATQIQSHAVSQAFGTTMSQSVFSATTATCGKRVTGTLPFAFVTPWPGNQSITLSAMACYPAA